MKKVKVLAIAAAAMLIMNGLTACGGGGGAATTAAATTAAATTAAPTTAAPAETKAETTPAATTAAETTPAATTAAETTAAAAEFTDAGEYTLFALQQEDLLANPEDLEMSSVMTLNEDGTGSMTYDEENESISKWEAKDGEVTITMSDDSSAKGKIGNGIIELDILGDGSMLMFYAQKDADISGYEVLTLDEIMEKLAEQELAGTGTPDPTLDSKVNAYYMSITPEPGEGLHMNYTCTMEALGATEVVDCQARGEEFYTVSNYKLDVGEDIKYNCFRDHKMYSLDPEDKTAKVVTEDTSSGTISSHVMMLDHVYSELFEKSSETEYTEETREIGGVSYDAVVFAKTEYAPEKIFCFDENGDLAYYVEGPPVMAEFADMGESVYKINVIDHEVDDSLFDLSGYKIEE